MQEQGIFSITKRPLQIKAMKNSLCDILLIPSGTQHDDLYPWYIVNCVLNASLTITAIILNSVTIQAIFKTSSLPTPLKALLLSLAFSDLGVGLVVQPFYFGLLVKWLQGDNATRAVCDAFIFVVYLFSAASFFSVIALSVDRFLAIHLHLRYQEIVTYKRVVPVVISNWVFSAFISLVNWRFSTNITLFLPFLGEFVSQSQRYFISRFISSCVGTEFKFKPSKYSKKQNGEEMANFARLQGSAVGTFYVYLLALLCYLPQFCSFAVVANSELSTGIKVFAISSGTLMLMNSSLNPVIYCWKMRHIRSAVMDLLRNVFSHKNYWGRTNANSCVRRRGEFFGQDE